MWRVLVVPFVLVNALAAQETFVPLFALVPAQLSGRVT